MKIVSGPKKLAGLAGPLVTRESGRQSIDGRTMWSQAGSELTLD